jgi:alpha-D-ribose 1-methylphosphonate 5-triphosphate diphosphatase
MIDSLTTTRCLLPDGVIAPATIAWNAGAIGEVSGTAMAARLDAGDMLVMPGMVDLHGDGFERQILPRPGVSFAMEIALAETDRQMLANGITTAFHAVTYSFEPGLRGAATVRAFMAAMRAMRGALGCDTRIHLRHETYNVDAVDEILGWIAAGEVDLLAFNDHTPPLLAKARAGQSLVRYIERSGLDPEAFRALLLAAGERESEIPEANRRLADAARMAGVRLASHDDETVEMRAAYRELGCTISDFPKAAAPAADARMRGETTILGAPNVVRGGSQSGGITAADAIRDGLCDALASDYYYPSLLQAPFRLAADGVMPLASAWALVSSGPAAAACLMDRGSLAPGKRADLVVVDDRVPDLPRAVAVIANGRPLLLDAGSLTMRG